MAFVMSNFRLGLWICSSVDLGECFFGGNLGCFWCIGYGIGNC